MSGGEGRGGGVWRMDDEAGSSPCAGFLPPIKAGRDNVLLDLRENGHENWPGKI